MPLRCVTSRMWRLRRGPPPAGGHGDGVSLIPRTSLPRISRETLESAPGRSSGASARRGGRRPAGHTGVQASGRASLASEGDRCRPDDSAWLPHPVCAPPRKHRDDCVHWLLLVQLLCCGSLTHHCADTALLPLARKSVAPPRSLPTAHCSSARLPPLRLAASPSWRRARLSSEAWF